MFENLKKRHSKKRRNAKNVSISGSGVAETSPALIELQKYSFMEWLNKYTRPKKTKTNLIDNDENIPDPNKEQGKLENEMESDSKSNYELPDDKSTLGSNDKSTLGSNDKSTLGSNEKAKQNTYQTSAPRKKEQSLKRRQRAHQKKILTRI